MAGLGRGLGALLSQSTTKSAKTQGAAGQSGAPGVVGQDLIVRSLQSKGVDTQAQTIGALQVSADEVLTPEVAPAPKRARKSKAATATATTTATTAATSASPAPKSRKTAAPKKPKAMAPESTPDATPDATPGAMLEAPIAVQGNLFDDVTPEQEAMMQQILDETKKRTKPKRRSRKATASAVAAAAELGAAPTQAEVAPESAAVGAEATAAEATGAGGAEDDNRIHQIALAALNPSSYQPRDYFDDDAIKELASSILEHGLLEPLIVKRTPDSSYEIICGERRYRAAKLAGLTQVPCLVRDVVDEKAYAIALIENIQRESLNPIELAIALEQMMAECGMTQEQVAASVGKSRSAVANYLRLTTMDERVQDALRRGDINFGHAKLIVGFDDATQLELCELIAKKQLSVRATEEYIKKHLSAEQRKKRVPRSGQADKQKRKEQLLAHLSHCESTLNSELGGVVAKFTLTASAKTTKGKLTLSYNNEQELTALLTRLGLAHAQ